MFDLPVKSLPFAKKSKPAVRPLPFIFLIAFGITLTVLNSAPLHAQVINRTIAVVRLSGASVLDAPSGTQTAILTSGSRVVATGRSADSEWLYGTSTDGSSGWIAADLLIVFGVNRRPVGAASQSAQPVQPATSTSASNASAGNAVATGASMTSSSATSSSASSTTSSTTSIAIKVNTSGPALNVRQGPGTTYAIRGSLPNTSLAKAIGRNAQGNWYQVSVPSARGGSGWVFAGLAKTDEQPSTLPVVNAPAVNTPAVNAPPAQSPTEQALSLAVSRQPQPATDLNNRELSGTIVFQTSLGGYFHAHELRSGSTRQLTYGFDAEISPDGRRVAFVREGGEQGLYLIDINGQNLRCIYSGGQWLAAPKWSPDGSHIVFSRFDRTNQCQAANERCRKQRREYRLSVVDTNGDNYHDLATLDSARAPDWNSAGITYASGDGIQMTQDQHKAENRLVTFDYLNPSYRDPDWQPNGGQIAFMMKRGNHWQIFGVNPDGGSLAALTRPLTTLVDVLPSSIAPAYSPNGQHIAYVSNRDAGEEAGAWGIWVMNADGSNQQKLPINLEINYTFGDEQAVSWGP